MTDAPGLEHTPVFEMARLVGGAAAPVVRYPPFDARHHGGRAGDCIIRHDPSRRAAWRWTCQPSGNRLDLCAECDAGWLRNADREPDLAPASREKLLS